MPANGRADVELELLLGGSSGAVAREVGGVHAQVSRRAKVFGEHGAASEEVDDTTRDPFDALAVADGAAAEAADAAGGQKPVPPPAKALGDLCENQISGT